jgi:hypothetical protein
MVNKQTKTIMILVPIYGLGWTLNNIKIDTNIEIRFINELKKESELLKKTGFNWVKYKCLLAIRYSYNSQGVNEPYPALQFLLDEIQAALRIFNPGFISFSGIISKPKVQPFPLTIDSAILGGPPFYKIDKIKLSKFPDFYQKFKLVYNKKKIAFDWFNKSYSEVPVNKVIDYCICLESLFVPPNSYEKKKFILQGLKLLNFSQQECDKTGILYDYRNAVIHADYQKILKIIKQYKITNNFYDICEKILREILELYIEKPW